MPIPNTILKFQFFHMKCSLDPRSPMKKKHANPLFGCALFELSRSTHEKKLCQINIGQHIKKVFFFLRLAFIETGLKLKICSKSSKALVKLCSYQAQLHCTKWTMNFLKFKSFLDSPHVHVA